MELSLVFNIISINVFNLIISFLCLTALVSNFTKVACVPPIIGFHNIRNKRDFLYYFLGGFYAGKKNYIYI